MILKQFRSGRNVFTLISVRIPRKSYQRALNQVSNIMNISDFIVKLKQIENFIMEFFMIKKQK